jgi:hypothetical protein
MKDEPRALKKTLKLNAETIRRLNESELNDAVGGTSSACVLGVTASLAAASVASAAASFFGASDLPDT